jgi:hypothetical protein
LGAGELPVGRWQLSCERATPPASKEEELNHFRRDSCCKSLK